jgi:hypothetical protein
MDYSNFDPEILEDAITTATVDTPKEVTLINHQTNERVTAIEYLLVYKQRRISFCRLPGGAWHIEAPDLVTAGATVDAAVKKYEMEHGRS